MQSRIFLALSLLMVAAGCSGSSNGQPPPSPDAGPDATACALPAGYDCCDGDEVGTFSCDNAGTLVCSFGKLTPSNQCTLPPLLDAGPDAADANTCQPPAGYECCDGDQLGTASCGSDGGVVCSTGTTLTPSSQCTLPPPLDAGPDAADANTCQPPTGYQCCDGDVVGTFTCGSDGGVVCSTGTTLTPSSQCTPPHDAGPDAHD